MIFLVSKSTPWSKKLHDAISGDIDCKWFKDDSYKEGLRELKPDWVFFFHWSRIVPEDIYKNNRCVVMHTGNLPRGRGGSPLQNQILDGIVESKVNAIVMGEELDAGDVYASLPVTLQGTIYDIWMTISDVSSCLIKKCVKDNPKPTPQTGKPQVYRRNRDNSLPLVETEDLTKIYRFIQMLDDERYPSAYIDVGKFRLTFSRSKMLEGEIISDVSIRKIDSE